MPITRTISAAGSLAVRPIEGIGHFAIFFIEALKRCVFPPVSLRLLFRQLEFVGNRSIGIIVLAAGMLGAIFGIILGDIFQKIGGTSMLGAAAGYAIANEFAPVFGGFLVTARAGSAMAAEIATMRVNEQIDAMRVMAVNPYGYLVAPRILGGIVMLPLLATIFMLVGVAAAYMVGVVFYDVDVGTFLEKMKWIVKPRYIGNGLIKAAVFGAILTAIGCYKGFHARGGAKGVGKATTEAVVLSLVSIIIADFFLSYMMLEEKIL